MRLLILGALSVCALFPLVGANRASAPAFSADQAGTYSLDGMHSTVLFRIKHMGVSYFYGRMNDLSGEVKLSEDPAECSVTAVIKAASVDSANKGRDDHIKGPDFMNVVQYPEVRFTSKNVKLKSEGMYTVTADFELHGVTKEVVVDMELVGARDTDRGFRAGFSGQFTINRRDYGIETYPDDVLSNEIDMILGIEAVRQ